MSSVRERIERGDFSPIPDHLPGGKECLLEFLASLRQNSYGLIVADRITGGRGRLLPILPGGRVRQIGSENLQQRATAALVHPSNV